MSKSSPILVLITLLLASCNVPHLLQETSSPIVPKSYNLSADTVNSGGLEWRKFFNDAYLCKLIDTALKNNKEMQITLQEIEIARNDIRAQKGKLLPTVVGGGATGFDKVGRYTSQGAGDASTEMKPGIEVPEWLPDYRFGISAQWEVDIWKKLHTEKKALVNRYLASVEGKNFLITELISDIANRYYELLALDNQLDIVRQSIVLQKNAFTIVKAQKDAGQETEFAVKKFEAELYNSQSKEFEIQQQIVETENEINLLMGRYPQPIERDKTVFLTNSPKEVLAGIPSQLMQYRPDVKQAEFELNAAKLDVKSTRAEFFPSLGITSTLGINAYKPNLLFTLPESILASLASDLAGPLINRNMIRAEFDNANARQKQALYNYEKTIITAFNEVKTEISNIENLNKSFQLKSREVDNLCNCIEISSDLFKAARVNYFEVLMTQRDALDSKTELLEMKLKQFVAVSNLYKSLGGGWK